MNQQNALWVRRMVAVVVVLAASLLTRAAAPEASDSRGAVAGYVRAVPPESVEHREARHREVARRLQQPALVILHRGASKFAPENTLEAYAAAMDRGADGCEIDIRRSADGVLYLHHDDDLGRVFEGSGPVSRLTYYYLLGRPLKEASGAGSADETTRIPTLAALLALAQQRAMLLHLDIKEPALDDDIAALLDAADAWDHVVHVNDYNSEKLRADPRLKLLQYKGWFEQAGDGEGAMEKFLARPGKLIIMDNDPAPAVKALGRPAPPAAVPLPREVRAEWLPPAQAVHVAVAEDSPDARPKDAPTKDAHGWRPLFNGKDLEGWNAIGSAKWRVEDGVIVGGQDGDPKRSGLLATKEQFTDFALELEFMIDEHGKYNSGVYLRNDPNTAARTGYQINIGRGEAEEYCAGLYTDHWLGKGDEKDTIRRKLAWNKLKILARGPHIESELNGVKVVDFTDPNPPAKFLQKGVLGLQTYGAEGHSGWVKFRNIRIRPIE
jgi:hypothetical protein